MKEIQIAKYKDYTIIISKNNIGDQRSPLGAIRMVVVKEQIKIAILKAQVRRRQKKAIWDGAIITLLGDFPAMKLPALSALLTVATRAATLLETIPNRGLSADDLFKKVTDAFVKEKILSQL